MKLCRGSGFINQSLHCYFSNSEVLISPKIDLYIHIYADMPSFFSVAGGTDVVISSDGSKSLQRRRAQSSSQTLLLYQYDPASSEFRKREMNRAELLKEVKGVADKSTPLFAEPEDTLHPPTPTARRRLRSSESFSGHYLSGQDMGIKARDIRKLDPVFESVTDASILVRYGAIIMCLGSGEETLRALVLRDRIYFVISDGFDSIITSVRENLVAAAIGNAPVKVEANAGKSPNTTPVKEDGPMGLPFEFRAIEAFLLTCTDKLRLQTERLTKSIQKLLGQIKSKSMKHRINDEAMQRRMFQHNEDAQTLINHAGATASALQDVLDSDEDMAYMYLSKLFNNPALFEHEDINAQHEEVEILLEYYLYEVRGILRQAQLLKQRMRNASAFMSFQLNVTRNRLQKLEITITSFSAIVALCAVVVGVFGMNLPPLTDIPQYISGRSNPTNSSSTRVDINTANTNAFAAVVTSCAVLIFAIGPLFARLLWRSVVI